MDTVLIIMGLCLLACVIILQIALLLRRQRPDLTPFNQAFQSVERAHERTERAVRDEVAKNREESAVTFRQSREELANSLKGFGDLLVNNMAEIGKLQKAQLDVLSGRLDKLTESTEQRLTAMRGTIEQNLNVP